MCGIYGVIGEWRSPEAGLHAIRRRGPDQSGHWQDVDTRVWLGFRRLAIIDLSPAGDQPMISPDGRYVMIYNGEIYNYRELRAGLEAAGEVFRGQSDSEVLLRLFAREGAAAFSKLNGIFAAAFWDRDERELTLLRDPMGVKPLYFAAQDGRIAFASEIKALIRAGDISPQLHAPAVLRHLGLLWSPGTETLVAGVEKLLPGEFATYRSGRPPVRQFYADPGLPTGEKLAIEPTDAIKRVAAAVEQAVERQLVSDVPLGCFLSGGLDSSAIAAIAARKRNMADRLQCFTIDLNAKALAEEGFAEDLPYARKVADHLDVDLHIVRADESLADRLQEMVYFLDEPTADFAALNTLLISELARQQGMTVLLSGAGGDDIFTGYRRHYALMQERWWDWLPKPVLQTIADIARSLPTQPSLLRRVGKAFANAGATADSRLAGYFHWLPPAEALALLSPEFRGALTAEAVDTPLLTSLARVPDGATSLDQLLYLERRHFLADHNLNYADKMGMASSIEIRVPLIDLELVRVAGDLPDAYKQRGRVGKWVFKKAMERYLPHEVIYRPKTGFGVPLRSWLNGVLSPLLAEHLSPARIASRGIFEPKTVAKLIDDTRAGRRDGAYTVFALLCLELWCRQYLDGAFAVD